LILVEHQWVGDTKPGLPTHDAPKMRPVSKQNVTEIARRFVREDDGQDLLEYGLLTGIVLTVGILIFSTISTKMGAAYTGWGTQIQDNWIPSDPAPPPVPVP
jgi:Flp pilus assembly pilin Flp